jgi:hypothetical protein
VLEPRQRRPHFRGPARVETIEPPPERTHPIAIEDSVMSRSMTVMVTLVLLICKDNCSGHGRPIARVVAVADFAAFG